MIQFIVKAKDGADMAAIGLNKEIVDALVRDGQVAVIPLPALREDLKVVLMFGETDAELAAKLKAKGIWPDDATVTVQQDTKK